MNASQLRKIYGENVDEIMQDMNPLAVAERFYFNSKKKSLFCYSVNAILDVIKRKMCFRSTFNSHYNICAKYLEITCPYCTEKMRVIGGGGSGDTCTTNYRCRCGAECSISTPESGISFQPGK